MFCILFFLSSVAPDNFMNPSAQFNKWKNGFARNAERRQVEVHPSAQQKAAREPAFWQPGSTGGVGRC